MAGTQGTSEARKNQLVKMTIAARRLPGWEDAKFLEEYEGVHANMTRGIAAAVPILRKYTQLVAIPHKPIAGLPDGGRGPWDAVSTLEWTSLADLHNSFQAPEYKASAGSHKFADESSQVGILSQEVASITLDPAGFEARGDSATLLVGFFARARGDGVMSQEDLAGRTALIEGVGRGNTLLRYVLNRSVTPKDTEAFFAGTPFAETDWKTTEAFEQYWFPSREAAEKFLTGEQTLKKLFTNLPKGLDAGLSFAVVGKEIRVVEKAEQH
ncbi:hypothetical protein CkaCkLH20_11070 [Colletotrichum karsti]|uniref:EthD domain-containing protein n=1 Tax=Colletotrichum karsti TaxID=1095194 RepID=A0A9P6LFF3_9PEZI|nr:uncharacterized protein CkaCkLH20_11070 [Colletotrichum karsti]KAF9871423.1 hypothetical protein CkaCkLH20_11070 [Colletotrichum karsti]